MAHDMSSNQMKCEQTKQIQENCRDPVSTTTVLSESTPKLSDDQSGSNRLAIGQFVVIIATEVMALGFGLWFK